MDFIQNVYYFSSAIDEFIIFIRNFLQIAWNEEKSCYEIAEHHRSLQINASKVDTRKDLFIENEKMIHYVHVIKNIGRNIIKYSIFVRQISNKATPQNVPNWPTTMRFTFMQFQWFWHSFVVPLILFDVGMFSSHNSMIQRSEWEGKLKPNHFQCGLLN